VLVAAEDPSVSGVSGRYATALFELARDEKSIDAVKADLDRFDAMLADSADLSRLVRSPVFSAEMQSRALSAVLDKQYPGIAFHAIGLTFGVLAVMLVAYKTGTIRVTQNFKLGVIAATGGIALFYLAEMVLGFFHIAVPAINGSGPIGIAFSLFVVVIAALNLVLDFDMIETGARLGAPKYMEWYGAFGLMVTLVWLYLEMLRLLSKLQRRN